MCLVLKLLKTVQALVGCDLWVRIGLWLQWLWPKIFPFYSNCCFLLFPPVSSSAQVLQLHHHCQHSYQQSSFHNDMHSWSSQLPALIAQIHALARYPIKQKWMEVKQSKQRPHVQASSAHPHNWPHHHAGAPTRFPPIVNAQLFHHPHLHPPLTIQCHLFNNLGPTI